LAFKIVHDLSCHPIACYAERCTISIVNPSVCLSIRPSYAGTVSKSLIYYNHAVFTGGQQHDSSFFIWLTSSETFEIGPVLFYGDKQSLVGL